MALNRWFGVGDSSLTDYDPFSAGYLNNFRQLDQQMRNLQREMDHMASHAQQHFNMSPLNFREAEANNMMNPVVTDKDGTKKIQYKLDVRQFKPEEITLKTKDNQLEVHAKHEEKTEHGNVYREYHRMCTLPKELDPHTLTSKLGNDGVLSIEAPLPKALQAAKESNIPITHEPQKK
jgi:HSP20 family molecular chaperone IbpA